MRIRRYSELIELRTFRERFEYLRLDGTVGKETFGIERYLNQAFYHSVGWGQVRNYVISRDLGCDLALPGNEIYGSIYVHHMNPLEVRDITEATDFLMDPEFLVCTSLNTHNAIHYGDERLLICEPVIRTPYDTCPWKRRDALGKHTHEH